MKDKAYIVFVCAKNTLTTLRTHVSVTALTPDDAVKEASIQGNEEAWVYIVFLGDPVIHPAWPG